MQSLEERSMVADSVATTDMCVPYSQMHIHTHMHTHTATQIHAHMCAHTVTYLAP